MSTPSASPGPGWVDATPFRAHVRFLMSVGTLSAADVATVAGVSVTAVAHLLSARGGDRARRLSPDTARRLLALSADDVRGLRWHLVPAHRARAKLETLRKAGLSDGRIAERARVDIGDLARLDGNAQHCSALLNLRLTAAVSDLVNRRGAGRGGRRAVPAAA
jgi:hypothetical protein